LASRGQFRSQRTWAVHTGTLAAPENAGGELSLRGSLSTPPRGSVEASSSLHLVSVLKLPDAQIELCIAPAPRPVVGILRRTGFGEDRVGGGLAAE
jgi:hypothetical protein